MLRSKQRQHSNQEEHQTYEKTMHVENLAGEKRYLFQLLPPAEPLGEINMSGGKCYHDHPNDLQMQIQVHGSFFRIKILTNAVMLNSFSTSNPVCAAARNQAPRD